MTSFGAIHELNTIFLSGPIFWGNFMCETLNGIGIPELHRRICIGLPELHGQIRIGLPEFHRRFRIDPT